MADAAQGERKPPAKDVRGATVAGGTVGPLTTNERAQFYERYARDARRPHRGSPVTDENLRQVAKLYRAAIKRGDPPTETVAETMHIARSTAARWVTRARERKLLGPALRGRAGEAD
jgi:hypothetical protein